MWIGTALVLHRCAVFRIFEWWLDGRDPVISLVWFLRKKVITTFGIQCTDQSIKRGTYHEGQLRYSAVFFGVWSENGSNANNSFLEENRRNNWFQSNFSGNSMVKLFIVLNLTVACLFLLCLANYFFLFLSGKIKKTKLENLEKVIKLLPQETRLHLFKRHLYKKRTENLPVLTSGLLCFHFTTVSAKWLVEWQDSVHKQICDAHLRSFQRSIQDLNELEQRKAQRIPQNLLAATATAEV